MLKKDQLSHVQSIIDFEIAKVIKSIKDEIDGLAKEIEVLKVKPKVELKAEPNKPVESKFSKKEIS
jgi:hypothetical protein